MKCRHHRRRGRGPGHNLHLARCSRGWQQCVHHSRLSARHNSARPARRGEGREGGQSMTRFLGRRNTAASLGLPASRLRCERYQKLPNSASSVCGTRTPRRVSRLAVKCAGRPAGAAPGLHTARSQGAYRHHHSHRPSPLTVAAAVVSDVMMCN